MAQEKTSIEDILEASNRYATMAEWRGTFADYLAKVIDDPSIAKLAHVRARDAIIAKGVYDSPAGESVYRLFDEEIFGIDHVLRRVVEYFETAANGAETSKRILLLLGPPASGKSTIVALIKRALEDYTRSEEGGVYAIAGCPMQEEPLHLIPHALRPTLKEQYGISIEGELNPRNRYLLKTEYKNDVGAVPVERVAFSEHEAVGIGYYVATNPNADSSILVGSIDATNLKGGRTEVAAKAFRMDGEFNVANRGMIELVEMFKADKRLLTSLLGLAQERIIKMEKFGSIYAEQVIIGHSNEGDFAEFAKDEHSEALKDRIIAIRVPYNLSVSDEVKIYEKVVDRGDLTGVCVAPLSLRVASVFAILSRLETPLRQGMTLLDKMGLYDGRMVGQYSRDDADDLRRQHPNEGMSGVSPRYVMNRVGSVASMSGIKCVTPLAVLNSLWQGMGENISYGDGDSAATIALVTESVKEYNRLATADVQRAFEDSFDETAAIILRDYLAAARASTVQGEPNKDYDPSVLQDMERPIGVRERDARDFRTEIVRLAALLEARGRAMRYTSDARLQASIERRLLPTTRDLQRTLARPRFARQRAEWAQRRVSIVRRLTQKYGYCAVCAEDALEYVGHVTQNSDVMKSPKNRTIDWLWELYPTRSTLLEDETT